MARKAALLIAMVLLLPIGIAIRAFVAAVFEAGNVWLDWREAFRENWHKEPPR